MHVGVSNGEVDDSTEISLYPIDFTAYVKVYVLYFVRETVSITF